MATYGLEQTKDWPKAIDVTRQIAQIIGVSQNSKIAHYQCEIAEIESEAGNLKAAHDATNKALASDQNSVRASIIQGQLFQQAGKYKDAIKSFRRIQQQEIAYLPEVLTDLTTCYRMVGGENDLLDFLQQCLQQGAGVSVLLAVSDLLQANSGERTAANAIADYLRDRPSIKGLEQLIQIHIHHASGAAKENLQLLHGLVVKLMDKKPVYRCDECGYSGKTLFWQCPSCKEWGTIKPILGIEGD